MRILKRVSALAMVLLLLAAALPSASAYNDIKDEKLSQTVEMLSALGIFAQDTKFNPDRTLDRASFCVLAVRLASPQTDYRAYAGYTKFPDVRAAHWGIGWINAAQSLGLMAGYANGNFGPNDTVDFRQVITVLLKVLGYTDKELGSNWPSNYLGKADSIGLTKGVSYKTGGTEKISRANTARLIYNLLFLNPKESTQTFLQTLGVTEKDVIVLGVDVPSSDGKSRGLLTDDGFYPSQGVFGNELPGMRCRLTVNKDGKVILATPAIQTLKTFTVKFNTKSSIEDTSGQNISIPSGTTVWSLGSPDKSVFDSVWGDIRQNERITIAYKSDGGIDYLFRTVTTTLGINEITTIILNTRATMSDGITKGVLTTDGLFSGELTGDIVGRRGKLRYDADNKIISFAQQNQTRTLYVVTGSSNNSIQVSFSAAGSSQSYAIPKGTPVFSPVQEGSVPYESVWADIKINEQLYIIMKSDNTTVDYIYRLVASNTDVTEVEAIVLNRSYMTDGVTRSIVTSNGVYKGDIDISAQGRRVKMRVDENGKMLSYSLTGNQTQTKINISGVITTASATSISSSFYVINYYGGGYTIPSDTKVYSARTASSTTFGSIGETGFDFNEPIILYYYLNGELDYIYRPTGWRSN